MFIEIENKEFYVNIDATMEYYKTHSICDCVGCKNFYIQISDKYPKLKMFLEKFGVDITRPDEILSIDFENDIDYYEVYYTVNGTIIGKVRPEDNDYVSHYREDIKFEIEDGTPIKVFADYSFIPNEQKEDYFTLIVTGIDLPYILDEPLTSKVSFKDKIRKIFNR